MVLSLCNLFCIQRIAGRRIDIDHTTILQHPKGELITDIELFKHWRVYLLIVTVT